MTAPIAPESRKAYALAGKATLTIVSRKSSTRFTFKIVAKDVPARDGSGETQTLHFVSLLNGSDNEGDYTFLGTIFNEGDYKHGLSSRVAPTAVSARAFAWTWAHLQSEEIEVWHSGTCGRCGRKLTTPESIERGLGEKCAGM